MQTLKAACDYARQGFAVFPCLPDKKPAVAGGFHSATTYVDQIIEWWSDHDDAALIGLAVPEGFVVIDIDPRNDGDKTIRDLVADGLAFPATRVARTGSGGWHRWYAVPKDVTLRSVAGPGVDLKRPGKGYVIMPPSVSDAGPYVWIDDSAPIAALPAETLEHLRKPDVLEARATLADFVPTQRAAWDIATRYGAAALANQERAIAGAAPGERNNVLNASAFGIFQLAHGGEIDLDYASEQLLDAARSIGLDDDEIIGTLRSANEAAALDPRTAPELEEKATIEGLAQLPSDAESHFWTDWEVDEASPPFYLWPILPKNAYVLVYGATEAAKSMVWNALLAEASHHSIRSSVYSLENPPHVDRSRLRRLGPDPENFRISHAGIDLADPRQIDALVQREQDWDTDVILIDTYSHAFSSRTDDGNAKAIAFARVIRHVMASVGCSVVVIDHTGYAQKDEPRDASAKRQQVDVAILMEREGTWTKSKPARFVMSNHKAARFANPFDGVRGAIKDTAEGDLLLDWADNDFGSRWIK